MDRFCSQCGPPLEKREVGGQVRPVCPACGHIIWSHFTLAVGGLLLHEGKALFIQRNLEPDAGQWTLPGGYVQSNEALDHAIIREYREETGLQVQPTGLLAIWQTPDEENNNSWFIFGLELTGPLSDLNPDPVEIRAARFYTLEELDRLEYVGRWSRWTAQHYTPQDAGLFRQAIDPAILVHLKNQQTALLAYRRG